MQSLEYRRLPSLVVCPPTLAGHWQFEIKTYAPFIDAVIYAGNPNERKRIRSTLASHDLVITTYDICRNDVDELSKQNWNYCVLDEGHVIKNARAKLTLAVKRLPAEHRLILSGTPIQNNVLELWSLFDFLMPGFLGSEKVFQERFAKPIAASRDSKSSSKEQEAGALALEALHKQVLPFLLRRLKEDVLSDLPPKIIQDYYCELSDIQKELYQDFAKSRISENLGEQLDSDAKPAKTHVFQALQYMRKLCNHPQLVLKPDHPKYQKVIKQLQVLGSNIRDLQHAPKFRALQELLLDCGIGVQAIDDHSESATLAAAVNQHRALIFCQQKEMLDMIEKDIFKALMPSVSYMRLDGGVDVRKRHEIVQMFNADPSIDLLLLTTHVGGLGLNLTGADTVIFVEHDWNPMKDLQAMDRAHRLGQKKVVNVYRLITRGTLEEKIMGLQRFKLNIASTVVNQQNAGLSTMDTGQILDLFNLGETIQEDKDTTGPPPVDAEGNPIKKGTKNVFEDLAELWDETQYEDFSTNEYLNGQ
ncbi:putative helicase mot1 [Neolecta irregularis DAH-3]|uniref:Putative helicase mot1 n=1 Tax=Neolecta irregularis (strain DAH-3) TaxID=1198029 RepID=A0A1U7LTL9_NEOID|nr:putative helicase mot1 [Neolecta irregularis DAH-3]|eukprot:OLL25958.1 putative helicase mot1 [Neolecta irregularis DAH-3]